MAGDDAVQLGRSVYGKVALNGRAGGGGQFGKAGLSLVGIPFGDHQAAVRALADFQLVRLHNVVEPAVDRCESQECDGRWRDGYIQIQRGGECRDRCAVRQ